MPADQLATVAGPVFMVSDALGNLAPGESQGLFAADTRYLSLFELRIDDADITLLHSGTTARGRSEIYATNSGERNLPSNSLEIYRRREIGDVVRETIHLTNRGDDVQRFPVSLICEADFADIFEVRAGTGNHSYQGAVDWKNSEMTFSDRRETSQRWTRLRFDPPPDAVSGCTARYEIELRPGETRTITVEITWLIPDPGTTCPVPIPVRHGEAGPVDEWLAGVPELDTDDRQLAAAYRQAVEDIASLEIPLDSGHGIPAAGLPWYMTIFGRDSIITSLQCMLTGQHQALGTLHTLAAWQSGESSDFHDTDPGKIAHEIRFGELALSGAIPHARYYGTADATPLWVTLLDSALQWTDSIDLINDLLPHVQAAMHWIDNYGDMDGDGFVEYQRRSQLGLINQGWKDSDDSVRFADGQIATGPIALVEVQGYVYAAKLAMARIYERIGRDQPAAQLRDQANSLKRRIHEAFWMPEAGYYAMALDGQKCQVTSIASNPGHLLWSGAIDPPYAERVAERLLAPDMFSGWGIRTMSDEMKAYNPFSYHNGSVWPHDNSLIVAGLARYGFGDQAMTVIDAMLDASEHFARNRLPELFCGYARDQTSFPVDYPVACSPQAWASGAVILMLQTMAGISATDDQLEVSPLKHGRRINLNGVQVGDSVYSVDCDPE